MAAKATRFTLTCTFHAESKEGMLGFLLTGCCVPREPISGTLSVNPCPCPHQDAAEDGELTWDHVGGIMAPTIAD